MFGWQGSSNHVWTCHYLFVVLIWAFGLSLSTVYHLLALDWPAEEGKTWFACSCSMGEILLFCHLSKITVCVSWGPDSILTAVEANWHGPGGIPFHNVFLLGYCALDVKGKPHCIAIYLLSWAEAYFQRLMTTGVLSTYDAPEHMPFRRADPTTHSLIKLASPLTSPSLIWSLSRVWKLNFTRNPSSHFFHCFFLGSN